jgi:hypothetical protein
MMNIAPMSRKTCSTGAWTPPKKFAPVTIRPWRMTSWMATMLTSVVSLLSVISWDTVAGTMRRRPWGSTIRRIDWR